MDLVGVSPTCGGWRDTASARASVRACVTSMLALAGLTAWISSYLVSPPSDPLGLRPESSSPASVSATAFMFGCLRGRLIPTSFVAYPLRLWGEWLSNLLVGNCRPPDGDMTCLLLLLLNLFISMFSTKQTHYPKRHQNHVVSVLNTIQHTFPFLGERITFHAFNDKPHPLCWGLCSSITRGGFALRCIKLNEVLTNISTTFTQCNEASLFGVLANVLLEIQYSKLLAVKLL